MRGLEAGPNIATLCLALTQSSDQPGRAVLVEQLVDRVLAVSPEMRPILGALLMGQADAEAQALGRAVLGTMLLELDKVADAFSKVDVDVLILTVKEVELHATLRAFGVNPGVSGTRVKNADPVYLFMRGETRICVAYVGFAGNVESSVRLLELMRAVSFKWAVLIGMAAGVRNKTKLGHVVLSESVVAYEGVKLTREGVVPSFRTHTVPMRRVRQMAALGQEDPNWQERLRSEIIVAEGYEQPPDHDGEAFDENWRCEVTTGVVLAGGTLFEDGSIPALANDVHARTKAVEMEGAGFSSACAEYGIEWLVVRGIADYGEPDRAKGWQFVAAYAAAAVVRDGLDTGRFGFTK